MTLQSEHRRLNLARCIRCGEFHATDKGCNVRSGHIAPVVRSADTACPFCGESGFDLIGLKSHISNGDCEQYNNTESIQRLF